MFHGLVGDTYGGGIVAVQGCWWLRVLHIDEGVSVCIALLSMMGWSGLGTDLRKKWPPAVLRALDLDKYEAS
eukprot:349196-Ditylum_brightwellii.AAC.1